MPDILEHEKRLRNGKDELYIPVWSREGLGNTNPTATLAPTLGSSAVTTKVLTIAQSEVAMPGIDPQLPDAIGNLLRNVEVATAHLPVVYMRLGEHLVVFETKLREPTRGFKPAGQVVLFKKIMEDWNFNNQEAATLLGFEAAQDINEIYTGMKSVRHRDANDRLRAVLRIAADLDALFQEVPAIRDWLSEPQRDLGGATPRSLLTEGSMENLLRVRHYASYLSGR